VSVYAFTWVYVNLCEFISIRLNQNNLFQMCMNLQEYYHDFILFISNYLVYSEFTRIYTNMSWIYWKICTLPDHWTAAHCRAHCWKPYTAAHTAKLSDTAVRSAAHCRSLHEFECRTDAHRTQSYTEIIMNLDFFIWMCMNEYTSTYKWFYFVLFQII
jgi:hypothetical protein